MMSRGRAARVAALALFVHVALAVLAAAWFQPLRPDYYLPAALSLAVLGGAGGPVLRAARLGSVAGRRAVAVVTVAAVLGLGGWNVVTDVRGRLEITSVRAEAAEILRAELPRDAYVLVLTELAGLLALDGYRAEGGWPALLREVQAGSPRPGLMDLIRSVGSRPVFVSEQAFILEPWQEDYLGVNEGDLWRMVQECCRLRPVVEYRTNYGEATLYLLEPPPGR